MAEDYLGISNGKSLGISHLSKHKYESFREYSNFRNWKNNLAILKWKVDNTEVERLIYTILNLRIDISTIYK